MNLHHFWTLSPQEQESIRREYPCYTEEEEQAFLNALFPAYETFSEADEAFNLSETQSNHDHAV